MGSSYTNILRENILSQVDIENHKVHSDYFVYTIKSYLFFWDQSLYSFQGIGTHIPGGIFYTSCSWQMGLI